MGPPWESGRAYHGSARFEEPEELELPAFSREQRLRLIEAIWGVVYSDDSLSEVEGHLARRIAELLGFQHPEVQAAKERVATSR